MNQVANTIVYGALLNQIMPLNMKARRVHVLPNDVIESQKHQAKK
jgi:hypothetical protein